VRNASNKKYHSNVKKFWRGSKLEKKNDMLKWFSWLVDAIKLGAW
jgi:hypothetical protein